MVSFSYREYLSTAGLALAVHVNFTIQPRHVSLVVTFAVKLTFLGLTAERQKEKNRSALVDRYIVGIHNKNYLWIFSTTKS